MDSLLIDAGHTSVLIADDHPMIANGVMDLISRQAGLRSAGWAANGRQAVNLFERVRPDVALFDIHMPELDGVEATRLVRAIDPAARVVIFTSFEEEGDIRRALAAGAAGYVLKSAPDSEVIRCIFTVAAGSKYFASAVGRTLAHLLTSDSLSDRELEILRLVADGNCNKRIARSAGITEGTAKSHLKNIFRKLGVSSRTEAVSAAVKRGVIRMA